MSEPAADRVPGAPLGAAVRLRGFGLRVGERWLLENVDLEFPSGKLCVIVGASGSGKSSFLKALAGLVRDDGVLRTNGDVAIDGDAGVRRVGLVFQTFALLDEFSPVDNVKLALDHRSSGGRYPKERSLDAAGWLEALHVPTCGAVDGFSGGQKQRLAIARTLAGHPDVVLYDEPTSGLDAWASANATSLICETQRKFGATSIVVTHDYASWLTVADHVFLLEPSNRTLVELHSRSPDAVTRRIRKGFGKPDEFVEGRSTSSNFSVRLLSVGLNVLGALGGWVLDVSALPLRLMPIWNSPGWGVRFLTHYLGLVAGYSAWLYVGVAGVIAGFVVTYFTFRYLPYQLYTKPLIMEELLASIGFALYRILVPVLATVLIAARCGAAVAADVGAKKYGKQFEALKTLGIPVERYVFTPILLAFLVGTPLLTQFAFWTAKLMSLMAFSTTYPGLGPYYWEFHFHRRLLVGGRWVYEGWSWVVLKDVLCGLMIGWVAYQRGARKKSSSRDVSRSITSTVLWATLAVLMVHFCVAFWEFEVPG